MINQGVLSQVDEARMRDEERERADMRYGFRLSRENSFLRFEELEAESWKDEKACATCRHAVERDGLLMCNR